MAKRRKKRHFNFLSFFGISVVVVAISVVTWIRGMSLQAQIEEYEIKEQQIQAQIEQEEERAVEIEEMKKYMQTKKYIEDVAKEKLKLVYPDEVILKPNEK